MGIPASIEVYPHPALVELASAKERLPYKVSKIGKYWDTLAPADRRAALIQQWSKILDLLEPEIAGTKRLLGLPEPSASARDLKSFEDKLDAVVCVWIGSQYLRSNTIPYGDQDSAIWVPKPRQPSPVDRLQPS